MTSANDNRTTERVDHPPRVREAIDELMREKDVTDNRTTELLRKLLDEHGARYEKPEDDTTIYYDDDGNRYTYNVNPDSGWAQLFGYNVTPEQAIAATLGSDEPPYDELLRCLENDWHISASWDGLRKFWCIELTEEGVKLRDATHGTLTSEQVEKAIHDCSTYASYDGCTYYASGIRLQAIADELNARAERTCRIVEYADAPIPVCSECGAVQSDDYAVYYCWSCGAKVRDE